MLVTRWMLSWVDVVVNVNYSVFLCICIWAHDRVVRTFSLKYKPQIVEQIQMWIG